MSPPELPPPFSIPPELRVPVERVMQQMRTEIIDAADMLQGLGLPADQAFTVVVHHSVRTACAMAMDVAIADGREPNLANWQAATTETFNKVLERWHQLTESGEPPDA